MKKKTEFSKILLIQESALLWITTLAYIVLAFYCIRNQYLGTLPWLTAGVSLPWAAYGVSQAFYYSKSKCENTKNGIKYELALKEAESLYYNQSREEVVNIPNQEFYQSVAADDPFDAAINLDGPI